MKRLSFSDLEILCEKENCRFNDLFLVGEEVFAMINADDWRLPHKYRPLLVEDSSVQEALPEILRRLDATEFKSMEVFNHKVWYESTLYSEFETLLMRSNGRSKTGAAERKHGWRWALKTWCL